MNKVRMACVIGVVRNTAVLLDCILKNLLKTEGIGLMTRPSIDRLRRPLVVKAPCALQTGSA